MLAGIFAGNLRPSQATSWPAFISTSESFRPIRPEPPAIKAFIIVVKLKVVAGSLFFVVGHAGTLILDSTLMFMNYMKG
jgi:hypothetical protein